VRKVPRHLRTVNPAEIRTIFDRYPKAVKVPERPQRAEAIVKTVEGSGSVVNWDEAYKSFFGKLRSLDGPPEEDISSLVNKRIGRQA
jgi:hypothetical protein